VVVNVSKWSRNPWIAFAIAWTAVGCVEVNGGAVELSWVIRDVNGTTCSCERAEIDRVVLYARDCSSRNADGSCVGMTGERVGMWACDDKHGITGFVIDEGRWAFSIEPVLVSGYAATADVPPPVIRDVVEGEPTQLDAWLIVSRKEGLDCRVGN
jgi:hypothetical protein